MDSQNVESRDDGSTEGGRILQCWPHVWPGATSGRARKGLKVRVVSHTKRVDLDCRSRTAPVCRSLDRCCAQKDQQRRGGAREHSTDET